MNSKQIPSPAKSAAFTLVELLTVIAIIGVLSAIIVPTVGKVRASARSAQALNNAKEFGIATLLYAQDNRGQVLGQRDANSWSGFEFLLNQTAHYISKTPAGNQDITIGAHRQLVDPLVPEAYQLYGNTYYYTWAINRSFNVNSGRSFDGTGAYTAANNGFGVPRRISEFQNPSRTIYAVSGSYELTLGNAANQALTNPPSARQAIFYYHQDGLSTPAVFLDGHTEMVRYPIPAENIRPQS